MLLVQFKPIRMVRFTPNNQVFSVFESYMLFSVLIFVFDLCLWQSYMLFSVLTFVFVLCF